MSGSHRRTVVSFRILKDWFIDLGLYGYLCTEKRWLASALLAEGLEFQHALECSMDGVSLSVNGGLSHW